MLKEFFFVRACVAGRGLLGRDSRLGRLCDLPIRVPLLVAGFLSAYMIIVGFTTTFLDYCFGFLPNVALLRAHLSIYMAI